MSKTEMIEFIIEETKKVSKEKNKKKEKRYLETAKLYLIKSTDAAVEALYKDIKKNGAEKALGDNKK